jgi:chemotaxis protein CheX
VKSNFTQHLKDWAPLLELAEKEVFELMLGCELTAPEPNTDAVLDVAGMVGLAGQLCGVLMVRCTAQSAALMACKMLGIEPAADSEMRDALAEVCNMVAGNFKNKIAGLGDGCMLSVPTVVVGNDYELHSMGGAAPLEVRLCFEGMPVVVSLQVHN